MSIKQSGRKGRCAGLPRVCMCVQCSIRVAGPIFPVYCDLPSALHCCPALLKYQFAPCKEQAASGFSVPLVYTMRAFLGMGGAGWATGPTPLGLTIIGRCTSWCVPGGLEPLGRTWGRVEGAGIGLRWCLHKCQAPERCVCGGCCWPPPLAHQPADPGEPRPPADGAFLVSCCHLTHYEIQKLCISTDRTVA